MPIAELRSALLRQRRLDHRQQALRRGLDGAIDGGGGGRAERRHEIVGGGTRRLGRRHADLQPPESVGLEGNQRRAHALRSEEHTSELQSLMRISYAVFCLKKKTTNYNQHDQLKKSTSTKPED